MNIIIKKIISPTILCISILILILTNKKTTVADSNDKYILKSYKNTVALYQNEKIITVYYDIVLNTLPPKDIHLFNQGVNVDSPADAELFLEDYDS